MTDTAAPPPPPPPGPGADPPPPEADGPTRPTAGPFAAPLSGRALRRSRTDRKVAGVAGGLGRWLDVDPTVLRVLFVVLTVFGGAGFLLYAVAWLVVPEDGAVQGTVPTADSVRNAVLAGALAVTVLVVLGVDSLDGRFFPWPLLVVGLVVAAVLLGRDDRRKQADELSHPTSWAATPPPPSSWSGPEGTEPTVRLEKPTWYPPTAAPPPPPPRRTGPLLFGPALALLALALGVLGMYDATGGDVASPAYPALALAVVGLALAVGAFVGRPGGLVLLGLVAAGSLLLTAVFDPAYAGPRELRVAPTRAALVDDAYHVPAGRIELDLSAVDPAALDGRTLEVSVGAGEVLVVVPREVRVAYDAAVDFGGSVGVGGRTSGGWSPDLRGTVGPSDAEAELTLLLAADFGQLLVVR